MPGLFRSDRIIPFTPAAAYTSALLGLTHTLR